MTDDRTQNDLARERTHAAWIRTCLTFLVTAVAYRHYEEDQWFVSTLLLNGAGVSALRAMFLAPDVLSRLMAASLVAVPAILLISQTQ